MARLVGKALVDGFFKTPVMRHVFQAVPIQSDVYCGHTWAAKEAKENTLVSVLRFQSRLRFDWQ